MSFARDYLQELKKLDFVVATRVEKLNLDPTENMLLAGVMLFADSDVENFKRINRLLNYSSWMRPIDRIREFYFLVYKNEFQEDIEDNLSHFDIIMKILRQLSSKIKDSPANKERASMFNYTQSNSHMETWRKQFFDQNRVSRLTKLAKSMKESNTNINTFQIKHYKNQPVIVDHFKYLVNNDDKYKSYLQTRNNENDDCKQAEIDNQSNNGNSAQYWKQYWNF